MKRLTAASLLLAAAIHFPLTAIAAATLVQDVRVFDGERMHVKRSVLIDGARIADADFKGPVPQGATVVSGTGRTLLPGLIDAHVHAYQELALPLLFGVTTQVDMFTSVPLMQEMTRAMQAGANSGKADLFSAGTLATAPGGHGSQFMPIDTLTTPAQAQAFVDARVADGSHFIKIVLEDGFGAHKLPSLDLPTATALIQAAHKRNKLAVVHVSTLANARAALQAGADGLVHLFAGKDADPEAIAGVVKLAKDKRAFVIPTFSILESVAGLRAADVIGDEPLMALLDKGQRAPLLQTYGRQSAPERLAMPKALTLALRQAGVAVLAGTDAGNAGTQYGISMHHELAALVKAGLTPVQALAAATSAPADAFKLGQRGRIANGYKADLLLVEGDPGADIANTRRIVAVWKDGQDAAVLRDAQRTRVAAEAAAKPGQALALPADGRISLFTKEKLGSPVGMGWMPSTDSFMGGKSTVQLLLQDAEPGAQPALAVHAHVQPGFIAPWAGVAFMPGKQPMAPADLSAAKVIRFKVRGDGASYALSMMSQGVRMPVSVPFKAETQWREVVLPFSSFKGIDAGAITMIAFNAGPAAGSYAFQIADVRLLNE